MSDSEIRRAGVYLRNLYGVLAKRQAARCMNRALSGNNMSDHAMWQSVIAHIIEMEQADAALYEQTRFFSLYSDQLVVGLGDASNYIPSHGVEFTDTKKMLDIAKKYIADSRSVILSLLEDRPGAQLNAFRFLCDGF